MKKFLLLLLVAPLCAELTDYIHPVADFPEPGVQFQWYGHLLREPEAFREVIGSFTERYGAVEVDAIAAIDARGFIFGAALAHELGVPLVLIRKAGKLPGETERIDYTLEYGSNSMEIEKIALEPGSRVLVIDDVIATGGTADAACQLVERLGAHVIEVACLMEIPALGGRERIGHPVFSVMVIQ